MYLRWRPKLFPHLEALRCISASSWGPSKESLSLLYKSLLWPLHTYALPGWFSFNITKLECLHRAASYAISGCLFSFPIPLLFFEVSLPPLQVALTHFTFLSYVWALRLPNFSISGLARLGVKPRLCGSSWRAFASTHSSSFLLLLLEICLRSQWSPPFHLHVPAPIPLSLAHLDSLPPHDLVLWTDGSVPFPFGKGGSDVVANCSLCGTEATLSFAAGPVHVCLSFSAEACTILQALSWSR